MLSLKTFIDARKFETQLKEKADPRIRITELVRCRNGAGKAFFAYIHIKPSEYLDYSAKIGRGEAVNPNEYEIVEYGWGEEPPAHLRALMEEKYGVDHDYEKKAGSLQEALEQAAV